MFDISRKTVIAASMCTFFVGSAGVSADAVSPDQSPFVSQDLGTGYTVVAEGKCGGKKETEGKCGGKKEAEGKCGGKKEAEGKCGEKKEKKPEGKCGEGKCGGKK